MRNLTSNFLDNLVAPRGEILAVLPLELTGLGSVVVKLMILPSFLGQASVCAMLTFSPNHVHELIPLFNCVL